MTSAGVLEARLLLCVADDSFADPVDVWIAVGGVEGEVEVRAVDRIVGDVNVKALVRPDVE